MNIFKILSSNDGTIKEPNISSFLAYLLDPNEDHGFSDLLLKSIIKDFVLSNDSYFSKLNKDKLSDYRIEINPEYQVFLDKKRRDIDIVIEIYNKANELLYTLCIENKITDNSINKGDNQLQDEFEGLKIKYQEDELDAEIYFIFLTLEESKKSEEEFNAFKYERKIHLFWKGENSIQKKILSILELERSGEIDPIPEDSMFLLKSFLAFIKTNFKSSAEEKNEKYERNSYGDKTVLEYFQDFAKSMDETTDYKVDAVKKSIADTIKNTCGNEVRKNTLGCHMYATIVNEKLRINYAVTENNLDRKNLFYYPDLSDKSIIRKYKDGMDNIEVFFKSKDN